MRPVILPKCDRANTLDESNNLWVENGAKAIASSELDLTRKERSR
ncbi:hypothetical protein [Coleofasciculus sp. FACHB-129]|nr:hypothetical protein [Coleofasciculus sp. FACHB-129]